MPTERTGLSPTTYTGRREQLNSPANNAKTERPSPGARPAPSQQSSQQIVECMQIWRRIWGWKGPAILLRLTDPFHISVTSPPFWGGNNAFPETCRKHTSITACGYDWTKACFAKDLHRGQQTPSYFCASAQTRRQHQVYSSSLTWLVHIFSQQHLVKRAQAGCGNQLFSPPGSERLV